MVSNDLINSSIDVWMLICLQISITQSCLCYLLGIKEYSAGFADSKFLREFQSIPLSLRVYNCLLRCSSCHLSKYCIDKTNQVSRIPCGYPIEIWYNCSGVLLNYCDLHLDNPEIQVWDFLYYLLYNNYARTRQYWYILNFLY